MKQKFLKIHPSDNVLVAITDIPAGDKIEYEGKTIFIPKKIRAKHKFTYRDIAANQSIIMYGTLVGKTVVSVQAGEALTVENTKHQAHGYALSTGNKSWLAPNIEKLKTKTFLGYYRNDGQVGTRNIWLVIPMVFCENRNVETLKNAFLEELGFVKANPYKSLVKQLAQQYHSGNIKGGGLQLTYAETMSKNKVFKNVDGIKFLTHNGGCGGTRQDAEALCALFAGYLNNPNVAGATILSLGCQNAQLSVLDEKLKSLNPSFNKPLFILEQQKEGTEENLLLKAIEATFTGLMEANKYTRKPAPLSALTIGLECGGSDGFSGISANPVVGQVSDLVTALGGKAILAEFPELCGVEQELINRCASKKTAEKFISLMKTYAAKAEAAGSGFDMNPSPGNIKDGLITDAMKSAGAAKKGGTSPVNAVLDYTEYATNLGLNLLCTPGNDVESTTALAGSGANIILFTTGLGTPTGNPVAPVIKIASNTGLAEKMPDIIDFDSGAVITEGKPIEEMGLSLLQHIIQIASGEPTKAELLGQDDFIPWKRGISL